MSSELVLLRLIHIISAVFMAWPLYALIVTGERARMGPPIDRVDRYMESIVKGMTYRCYAFQAMVAVSGILMTYRVAQMFDVFITNPLLASKSIFLLALVGLLSYVHLRIQPRIDALLEGKAQLTADEAAGLRSLRLKRRKMAGVCLFLVLASIIFGVQVWTPFNPLITVVLLAVVVLFVWRAYVKLIPYGWI